MERQAAWMWGMSLLMVGLGGLSAAQEEIPAPTPEEASEARPLPEEPAQPGEGAPTLDLARAEAIALAHNFGLLSAEDAVKAARAHENAAFGVFLPKLTPSYQGGKWDTSYGIDASERLPWTGGSVSLGGTLHKTLAVDNGPTVKSSDVEFLLTQPLLRGAGPNASLFELRNSRRGREGEERGFEIARQRLIVDVTAAFYLVVRQRELVNVARQGLRRTKNLKEASESRMKVGLASKLDVFRAELQASQTEEAQVQAETGLQTALEQFRVLLGLDPSNPVEPAAAALPDTISSGHEPVEILVQKAIELRLEIKEARDQVKDAERAASFAKQNLLPQLDFNVGVSQVGLGPTYSDSLKTAETRVNVYLSTSYPVERSADKAAESVAELDLEAKKRALAQRELDVAAEVRGAVRTLERIAKSVELQKKAVDFAAQQHRLATLRYQRGLASNFDVVDAESNLLTSRTALVGLLTDYQVAQVQLQKSLGTLKVDVEAAP